MEVHLYALCWNELDILPFFFRHYDCIVSRYFIFDNGSSDGSVEFLAGRHNVEVHRFVPRDPDSFVISEQLMSNECWKPSRGHADWVIVTDVDEHLYHPAMDRLLQGYSELGVTLVPALGFEMVSEDFPQSHETLCETRTKGVPSGWYSKASVFNPNAIDEIFYGTGRHWASPTGNVIVPSSDALRLLHYKHIGYEQTLRRYRQLRSGFKATDIKNGWDVRHLHWEQKFAEEWRDLAAAAVDVFADASMHEFVTPPWWEKFRLGRPPDLDPSSEDPGVTANAPEGPALTARDAQKLLAMLPDLLSEPKAHGRNG